MSSFFPIMEKGGWVMWPIAFLSVVSLALMLERLWFFFARRSRILSPDLIPEVEGFLRKGEVESAVLSCQRDDSMLARILLAGLILAGSPREVVREALEDAGRRETRPLERFLGTLAAIAGVSPLLGFLGTVLGMVEIFEKISDKHIGDYSVLAHGIYIALYTTVFGLIVAIPAYLAYRAFSGLAERRARDLEDRAVELLNLLTPAGRSANPRSQ